MLHALDCARDEAAARPGGQGSEPNRPESVHGLAKPEQVMEKGGLKTLAYKLLSLNTTAFADGEPAPAEQVGRGRARCAPALAGGPREGARGVRPRGQAQAVRAPPEPRGELVSQQRASSAR